MERAPARAAARPASSTTEPQTGGVVRIFPTKGFAFINSNGLDYFLHASELLDCEIASLAIGDQILFTPSAGEKGPRASQAQRCRR